MEATGAALQGFSVVITRPAGQSARLAEQVEAEGGIAVLLPLFAIEAMTPAWVPPPDPAPVATVFVSVNAVRHGLPLVRSLLSAAGVLIGVGGATVAALRSMGLKPLPPLPGAVGSEELLGLPALAEPSVRGRRVVLVSGEGGRDMLKETLTARGADVVELEVYRRVPRDSPIAATMQAVGAQRADILVLTSSESADQLLKLINDQGQASLLRTPVAAMSRRVAAHARDIGFIGEMAIAPETSDDGLMQAILQLAAP